MTSSTERDVAAGVDHLSQGVAQPSDDAVSGSAAGLAVALVGMSVGAICGVRDHAFILAKALEKQGASCSTHWLMRSEDSLWGSRAEIRSWAAQVGAELQESRPDVAVLQYSVFDYTHRGIPMFVHPTLSAVRRARVPVVAFLHEPAYPWRRGGWRGSVWASSQRAALVELMRTARAAMVTVDFRASWLASRRWLPRRPLAVAPAFSNLPLPSGSSRPSGGEPAIGIFGYSYENIDRSVVLDALRIIRDGGVAARLRLLGAPGRSSESGEQWLELAGERGVSEALTFSGTLHAQALSDELAACDVLLFADSAGPSSRKGSLAAALASGRPVVAIDGHNTWDELVRADVVRVVEPSARALADGAAALIRDRAAADGQGARGRAFHEQKMGVSVTMRAFLALASELGIRSSGLAPLPMGATSANETAAR
jgi:glycosyltransferase involved in cell wall biosynthesis